MACLAMIAGHFGHRVDLLGTANALQCLAQGDDPARYRAARRTAAALDARAAGGDVASRAASPALHPALGPQPLRGADAGRQAHRHHPRSGARPRKIPLEEVSRRFTGIALEAWPTEGFERKTERARIRIFDLVRRHRRVRGRGRRRSSLMSLFLEAIVIATPIGFQLVLDEVIVANDRDLLVLIALGLGLILAFRALTDFIRSWAIMAAGAKLTLQWKMSLFRSSAAAAAQLLRAPPCRRPRLALQLARHDPEDADHRLDLRARRWRDVVRPGRHDVALQSAARDARPRRDASLRRDAQPRLPALSRANEEAIVYAAQENSHFIETLRGMPSIKALVIGDRRQACWNNYLVDEVGADLRVQKLDLVFKTANTLLFGLDRILIIFFGARAVMSGSLTIGMLVAFLAYKDQFSTRIATLLDTVVKLSLLDAARRADRRHRAGRTGRRRSGMSHGPVFRGRRSYRPAARRR